MEWKAPSMNAKNRRAYMMKLLKPVLLQDGFRMVGSIFYRFDHGRKWLLLFQLWREREWGYEIAFGLYSCHSKYATCATHIPRPVLETFPTWFSVCDFFGKAFTSQIPAEDRLKMEMQDPYIVGDEHGVYTTSFTPVFEIQLDWLQKTVLPKLDSLQETDVRSYLKLLESFYDQKYWGNGAWFLWNDHVGVYLAAGLYEDAMNLYYRAIKYLDRYLPQQVQFIQKQKPLVEAIQNRDLPVLQAYAEECKQGMEKEFDRIEPLD